MITPPGEPYNTQDSIIQRILLQYNLDEELAKIALGGWHQELNYSSYALIENALDANKITEEEALVYRTYALLAPSRLPSEFRGAPLHGLEGDRILLEIQWKWDQLSDTTRQLLAPFRDVAGPSGLEKRAGKKRAAANSFFLNAMNDKVKILYYSDIFYQLAVRAKETIERAWPLYTSLLGREPDKLVSLHITDFVNTDTSLGGPSGYVGLTYLDTNLFSHLIIYPFESCVLTATVSHELMHCFQYYNGLGKSTTDWIDEATAVWAEDLVNHPCNSEHIYHQDIFSSLNEDMFSIKNDRNYGSYLWFYYIYLKFGKNMANVGSIMKNAATSSTKAAIESISGFKDVFKEYALWNWTYKPVLTTSYEDDPVFVTTKFAHPHAQSLKIDSIGYDTKKDFHVVLGKGSMHYTAIFIHPHIEFLKIRLNDIVAPTDASRAIQAVIRVGSQWKIEDWSQDTLKVFNRATPTENVNFIAVIVSSSNLDTNFTGNFSVDSRFPRWKGTVTINTESLGVNPKVTKELVMEETLTEIERNGSREFIIEHQELTFSEISSSSLPCLTACTGETSFNCQSTGKTTRTIKMGRDTLTRLYIDKPIETVYLKPTDAIYGNCDYVTSLETTTFNCTCPGYDGPVTSFETQTDTIHGICHGIEDLYDLPILSSSVDANYTHIWGSETGFKSIHGSTVNIKWDFRFE